MKNRSCFGVFTAWAAVITFTAVGIARGQVMSPPPVSQPPTAAPVTQWPQRLDSPDGLITVYEPQPSKFEGDTITARAAVSLTPPGATDPEFGALWFTARVSTDRDARIVTVQNVSIKQVKLPNASADQDKQFGQVLEARVPSMNLMLSLDQLESTLGVVQKAKEESQQLQNSPPKIVFTTTPTTLVLLDGPPKLQPAPDQGVMAVVNTPFIMLMDLASKRYFLKAGEFWMVAPDVTGPWTPAGQNVPAGVVDSGTKLQPQGQPAAAQQAGPTAIYVAEEPTELISSQGPPTYTPIEGNDLLYMSNTQSDVFMAVANQQFYVLLSGRWFNAPALAGPWAFIAADKLPPAFAQIPPNSPKANVLASVANTQQAKDARLDAFIPQTTAIRRDSGSGLTVAYDGAPQFVPVADSQVTYASNCADPVLLINNGYYCCHQAVWYSSAAAAGPWVVCTSVPNAIYTLPPSCPVYYCRYVYVYDSTPETVYCGYLPGYTGCYVYGPTVVYGTGYAYPYWYGSQFIPGPYTFGFAASYDYYAGTWGYGASFGYSAGWFADRPYRQRWFGSQGYVDYHDLHNRFGNAVNVRSNERNVTVNRINIYNRQENVKRNVAINDEAVKREATRNPQAARPAAENNVMVGQDGQVYRKTATGWETHDAKGWSAYKPPAAAQNHETTPAQHAEEQHHETPAQATPHETPAHEAPAHEAPQHEAPAHDEPSHAPQPGLDEEYNARQRAPAYSPPAEQHSGGGNNSGGGNSGGGGGAAHGGGKPK